MEQGPVLFQDGQLRRLITRGCVGPSTYSVHTCRCTKYGGSVSDVVIISAAGCRPCEIGRDQDWEMMMMMMMMVTILLMPEVILLRDHNPRNY